MECLLNLVVVIMAILIALVTLSLGEGQMFPGQKWRGRGSCSCYHYEVYSVAFSEYQASLRINDNDLQKEPAFSVFSPILFWLQLTETLNLLKSTQRIKTSHALQS